MSGILHEITPLSEGDFFYLIERNKQCFDYPLHRHDEYELNFVANCRGAHRVVGDKTEVLGDYDLALVGDGIEHAWLQGDCTSTDIHEITLQFSPALLSDSLLMKRQMTSISDMLRNSGTGIAFEMPAIMNVYSKLVKLTQQEVGFYRVITFLEILYDLSQSKARHRLANSNFTRQEQTSDSRRVRRVQAHIEAHFREPLPLDELAQLVAMTPSSFSRFFKQRTGVNISDYITDCRLGHAMRRLVDTTESVSEICFGCGFNNISNFNRIFKRKKGITPKEFREYYRKQKVLT